MPCPSGPVSLGSFQHPGGQDDRGGEQEREPGRVLPGQAAAMPATMVTPSRLIPASSARICAAPMVTAFR